MPTLRNAFVLAALVLAGCATNPVTGERNLNLYGEDWDRQVGEQQYAPLRQAQGGDFVLEPGIVDYVQNVGQRVAAQSDQDLPYEFAVINSSVPNAWALPGGKISINRGLLTEMNSEAELAAVLGHEVVHAAARHGAQAQSRGTLLQAGVVLGGIAVGAATERDEYATVALLGGMVGAQLINQRYSRGAELQSDYYGMKYMNAAGYNPEAAVELQETFVRLSEGNNPGFLDGLFASHPPSRERVERNRQTLMETGSSGKLGREEYQRRIATLTRLQPAYRAHDEGRKALADGDAATARRKAEEALGIEHREALFHALLGDARATEKDWPAAEAAYSRALQHDNGWFYHPLRRGMVREKQGELAGARGDLQASLELLETAQGHFYLGNVERAAGNRTQAIEHYRTVAQAQPDSEVGQASLQALQEMGAAVE